jgi:hypothetical protein
MISTQAPEKPSCCKLIKTSIQNLMNLPSNLATIIPFALRALPSIITTPLSCITAGQFKFINEMASEHSLSSNLIFFHSYTGLISIINPKISIDSYLNKMNDDGRGIITSLVVTKLFEKAQDLNSEKKLSFCKKHIFSRVLFALGGILSIITKIADVAIGLIGALVVALTFAQVEKINMFAINNLITFPGVFHNVFTGMRGFIHPTQSELENT